MEIRRTNLPSLGWKQTAGLPAKAGNLETPLRLRLPSKRKLQGNEGERRKWNKKRKFSGKAEKGSKKMKIEKFSRLYSLSNRRYLQLCTSHHLCGWQMGLLRSMCVRYHLRYQRIFESSSHLVFGWAKTHRVVSSYGGLCSRIIILWSFPMPNRFIELRASKFTRIALRIVKSRKTFFKCFPDFLIIS